MTLLQVPSKGTKFRIKDDGVYPKPRVTLDDRETKFFELTPVKSDVNLGHLPDAFKEASTQFEITDNDVHYQAGHSTSLRGSYIHARVVDPENDRPPLLIRVAARNFDAVAEIVSESDAPTPTDLKSSMVGPKNEPTAF